MNKTFGALALMLGVSAMIAGCVNSGMESDATFGQTSSALTVASSSCGHNVAPLMLLWSDSGATNIGAGSVTVTNTADSLILTFNADEDLDWSFTDIIAFAGPGGVPLAVEGWPDFNQFPYAASFSPVVKSQQVTIPLASLLTGDPAGQTLNISVHVSMARTDAVGNMIETAQGWSFGQDYTGSPYFAVIYPYTVCNGGTSTNSCAFRKNYWKKHHDTARGNKRIDWPAPMDERQKLCSSDSRSLLTILDTNVRHHNAYLRLAHQYIAAKLNVSRGATPNAQTVAAITQANAFIDQYCGQIVQSSTVDGKQMGLLTGVLRAYNTGNTGQHSCSDDE